MYICKFNSQFLKTIKTKNILFFYFLNMANSQHTFMKKKIINSSLIIYIALQLQYKK